MGVSCVHTVAGFSDPSARHVVAHGFGRHRSRRYCSRPAAADLLQPRVAVSLCASTVFHGVKKEEKNAFIPVSQ